MDRCGIRAAVPGGYLVHVLDFASWLASSSYWLSKDGSTASAIILNHQVGISSPSPPTYVSDSEVYVQVLGVVQNLQ